MGFAKLSETRIWFFDSLFWLVLFLISIFLFLESLALVALLLIKLLGVNKTVQLIFQIARVTFIVLIRWNFAPIINLIFAAWTFLIEITHEFFYQTSESTPIGTNSVTCSSLSSYDILHLVKVVVYLWKRVGGFLMEKRREKLLKSGCVLRSDYSWLHGQGKLWGCIKI